MDFAEGSQDQTPEATRKHAMAALGQDSSDAIAATKGYIQESINKGKIPEAIHAAQDLATPGHAGVVWTGFRWNLATAKHLFGDTFPGLNTIKQAYNNTINVFKKVKC